MSVHKNKSTQTFYDLCSQNQIHVLFQQEQFFSHEACMEIFSHEACMEIFSHEACMEIFSHEACMEIRPGQVGCAAFCYNDMFNEINTFY